MALFLQTWFKPNPNHPGAFMLRVYTYLRRAQTAQHGEEDAFTAWFEAHPYATRGADYTDLGVSGLTAPGQRPGFAALLSALEADKPDFVLVRRPEDLGRSLPVTLLARNLIDLRGVDLLCVERAISPTPAA